MFLKLIAVTALLLGSFGLAGAAPGRPPCCKKLAPCCTKHCCFVR